jgi:hypothetical protein
MIKPKLILCADYAMLDSQTNGVSVINILEDITPEGFPLFLPRLTILSILEKDPEDPDTVATRLVVRLNEQQIFTAETPIEFQGKKRNRHITVLGGVPIPNPGPLTAVVLIDGNEIHSYTVEINPSRAQPQIREEKASYGG